MKSNNLYALSFIVAGLITGVLMGCNDGTPPKAEDSAGTGVHLVTLEDGTRCAVAYGGTYGRPSGVDCDWQHGVEQ